MLWCTSLHAMFTGQKTRPRAMPSLNYVPHCIPSSQFAFCAEISVWQPFNQSWRTPKWETCTRVFSLYQYRGWLLWRILLHCSSEYLDLAPQSYARHPDPRPPTRKLVELTVTPRNNQAFELTIWTKQLMQTIRNIKTSSHNWIFYWKKLLTSWKQNIFNIETLDAVVNSKIENSSAFWL